MIFLRWLGFEFDIGIRQKSRSSMPTLSSSAKRKSDLSLIRLARRIGCWLQNLFRQDTYNLEVEYDSEMKAVEGQRLCYAEQSRMAAANRL